MLKYINNRCLQYMNKMNMHLNIVRGDILFKEISAFNMNVTLLDAYRISLVHVDLCFGKYHTSTVILTIGLIL